MDFSVYWRWFATLLLCLLCMGANVQCYCTEQGMEMNGGSYILTKDLSHGSRLIYQCPEGYYPFPAAVRSCGLSNNWNPPTQRTPQRCRMVQCPDPILENGDISPPQERYFVNNRTTYECYSGYTLRGSASRVCMANGKWSGSTPICSRDSGENCADPGIPAGARRTGHLFGIGDKVTYNCGNRLFLVGSEVRVCQENGEWTGNEPTCYYKYTYDTAEEVAQAFGSSIKQSLRSFESFNDTQKSRMIKVTENGTLNLYIAVDISESIKDEEIANATKAVDQLISKISSFNTNPNYEIFFFSSAIFEIVNIFDFFDLDLKPRDTMRSKLETFKLDRERGEEVGTDLTLAFNHILNKMAYIKQQAGEAFNDHQHVIVFFTDGIYNMGGTPAPTVAKIKQLVYGPKTDGEAWKKREEYLDIYIFGIGAEVYDDDLQPLTTGTGGLHYFRMKDLSKLQQTFDEIIDEEAVKGLCGLHRKYNYDRSARSTQRMYPWLASVIVKNRKCLGSLVTPKFILTAAHCFRFDDELMDIQVEIDDGVNIVHQVDWFKLHPDYKINAKANGGGVAEFYDYDVALIRLKEYVEISVQVRPICIPCTLETNEALGLGDSTCSQQEELLLKNQLERLTFLTKTSTIEAKDVHAKMGDNRDECISHALKAKGITTKNPKDAVTDNFLCTGGRDPFVDHIACTGDSGGAVFKNFEHRTIQIAIVSWGTKHLCTGGGVVSSNDDSRDFHINLFRVVPFLKEVLQNNNQTKFTPLEFLAD